MTRTKTQDKQGDSALWGKFLRSTQVYVWIEPKELDRGKQNITIMLPKDRARITLSKYQDSPVDTSYVQNIKTFSSTLYNIVSRNPYSSVSKNRLLPLAMTPLAETCLQILRLCNESHNITQLRRSFPLEGIYSEIIEMYNANPAPRGW